MRTRTAAKRRKNAGNKPAFLTNPAHVFVAPVWLARKIFGVEKR
jgi:hypothetical protein